MFTVSSFQANGGPSLRGIESSAYELPRANVVPKSVSRCQIGGQPRPSSPRRTIGTPRLRAISTSVRTASVAKLVWRPKAATTPRRRLDELMLSLTAGPCARQGRGPQQSPRLSRYQPGADSTRSAAPPDCASGDEARTGTRTAMRVPCPGWLETSTVPE